MPVSNARRVGAYGKLLANYASDDAVMDAGEAAELLFVRGIAFCATSDSDGYMTEAQVLRYVGAGMRDAKKRAERLVDVGLWLKVEGGYVARSHTKIHETAEEKGYKLKADRERKRVTSGPKGAPNPAAFQTDSARNPDGIQMEGAPDSLSLIHNRTEHNRTETGHDTARNPRLTARDIDAAFAEFWSVFPKKVAKQAAQRRFETLIKRGTDPVEIIAGAKAYRESRHGEDPQFTKQPDGWLNAGRWQDEPPPAYRPPDQHNGSAKARGWIDLAQPETPDRQAIEGRPA